MKKKEQFKAEEVEKKEEIVRDYKLESAIRILIEKITQSGQDLEGKSIIIKDGKLTIK